MGQGARAQPGWLLLIIQDGSLNSEKAAHLPPSLFVSASTIFSGSVDLSLRHSSRRGESFFPKCLKGKNFEQTAKRGKERRLAIVWGTEGGRLRRHQPCTGRPAGGRAGEPQLTG